MTDEVRERAGRVVAAARAGTAGTFLGGQAWLDLLESATGLQRFTLSALLARRPAPALDRDPRGTDLARVVDGYRDDLHLLARDQPGGRPDAVMRQLDDAVATLVAYEPPAAPAPDPAAATPGWGSVLVSAPSTGPASVLTGRPSTGLAGSTYAGGPAGGSSPAPALAPSAASTLSTAPAPRRAPDPASDGTGPRPERSPGSRPRQDRARQDRSPQARSPQPGPQPGPRPGPRPGAAPQPYPSPPAQRYGPPPGAQQGAPQGAGQPYRPRYGNQVRMPGQQRPATRKPGPPAKPRKKGSALGTLVVVGVVVYFILRALFPQLFH